MNIFYLNKNLKKAAQQHVDKHIVKMPLELAQLLCSAIWLMGGTATYKLTHKNHPCSRWVRESNSNWLWLKNFGLELCYEYTYRYGKIHKCQGVIEGLDCPNLPDKPFSQPPQAMPDIYKCEDSIEAYRQYYINEKYHLHSWKSRPVPEWLIKDLIE